MGHLIVKVHLKSSMDRFIVKTLTSPFKRQINLKSSMDRFIDSEINKYN